MPKCQKLRRLRRGFGSKTYPLAFDGDFLAAEVAEVLQQHVLPVAAIRDQTEIRQRLLRRADLLLDPGQQVTWRTEIGTIQFL